MSYEENGAKNLLNEIGDNINGYDEQSTSSDREIPFIFEYLPSLVHDMFKKNINFSIESNGDILVKDFYRPAVLKMTMEQDESFSIELRKDNIKISKIDDLIDLNYKEWKKTGKGKGNYDSPAKCWTDLFGEKGLIKRQVVFIPTDD